MTAPRPAAPATPGATPVEALADDYLERSSLLDPCNAARMAIGGPSDELTDYSRQGEEARGELDLATRRDLDAIDDGSTTACMLREWLDARVAAFTAGDDQYLVRIIGGPVEGIRSAFDNMAKATTDDWELIVSRLGKVPGAIGSARSGIEGARAGGRVEARRQVLAVAAQCDTFGGSDGGGGWFATLAEECRRVVPTGPLLAAADRAAGAAAAAYRDLGAWLRTDYAPLATDSDGVGPERYGRAACSTAPRPHPAGAASPHTGAAAARCRTPSPAAGRWWRRSAPAATPARRRRPRWRSTRRGRP